MFDMIVEVFQCASLKDMIIACTLMHTHSCALTVQLTSIAQTRVCIIVGGYRNSHGTFGGRCVGDATSLGSGVSMVARLKLKTIDGRAPPGVQPAT